MTHSRDSREPEGPYLQNVKWVAPRRGGMHQRIAEKNTWLGISSDRLQQSRSRRLMAVWIIVGSVVVGALTPLLLLEGGVGPEPPSVLSPDRKRGPEPISVSEDVGKLAAELREARGALEQEKGETRKAMGLAKQEEAARKRAEAAATNLQQMVQEEAKARSKAETELQKAASALKVAQEKATADGAELKRVKNDLATETKLRSLADAAAKNEQEKAEAALKRVQKMQALVVEDRRPAGSSPERVDSKKLERPIKEGKTKITIGAGVYLRDVPKSDGKKLSILPSGTLPFGTVVTVFEKIDDPEIWFNVSLEDGTKGWIPGEYLTDFDSNNRVKIHLEISKDKIRNTNNFGDLVEVSNFLFRISSEALQSEEIKSLLLSALRKSLAVIPSNQQQREPRHQGWIQKHKTQPYWKDICGALAGEC